jgi:hypothetical protein
MKKKNKTKKPPAPGTDACASIETRGRPPHPARAATTRSRTSRVDPGSSSSDCRRGPVKRKASASRRARVSARGAGDGPLRFPPSQHRNK